MKNKILPFIKKYPMSILLGLIAIQLVNIAGKLDQSGRYDADMRACIKYYAFYDERSFEIGERERKRAAVKIGVPLDIVDAYCRRLM